jgi:hypothetical protein
MNKIKMDSNFAHKIKLVLLKINFIKSTILVYSLKV